MLHNNYLGLLLVDHLRLLVSHLDHWLLLIYWLLVVSHHIWLLLHHRLLILLLISHLLYLRLLILLLVLIVNLLVLLDCGLLHNWLLVHLLLLDNRLLLNDGLLNNLMLYLMYLLYLLLLYDLGGDSNSGGGLLNNWVISLGLNANGSSIFALVEDLEPVLNSGSLKEITDSDGTASDGIAASNSVVHHLDVQFISVIV